MIGILTFTMPQYEKYLSLYPKNPVLESHIRSIFSHYSDFCIFTIKFLKRRPACELTLKVLNPILIIILDTLVPLAWGTMTDHFEKCKTEISKCTSHFQSEVDFKTSELFWNQQVPISLLRKGRPFFTEWGALERHNLR